MALAFKLTKNDDDGNDAIAAAAATADFGEDGDDNDDERPAGGGDGDNNDDDDILFLTRPIQVCDPAEVPDFLVVVCNKRSRPNSRVSRTRSVTVHINNHNFYFSRDEFKVSLTRRSAALLYWGPLVFLLE